jgi:hypothetical protein
VISTTLRTRWVVCAVAVIALHTSAARADDPPPIPPPPPSSGPPGAAVAGPPYGPPVYPPPPYNPPVYGPAKITDFDDSQPVPYGYTAISRKRKGLIIAGACVFGGVYGYTALSAAYAQEVFAITGSDDDVTSLWIPVAGPFLQLSDTDNAVARFGLVLDGLAQGAGALMLLYGLTTPRTILVRNDQLTVTPMVRPGATGLVLSGQF